MSVVKGQAVRRREGSGAPNTLVMAQEQPPAPADSVPCHVKGCGVPLHSPNGRAGDDYYMHMLANHPRSSSASAARDYFRDQEARARSGGF